MKGLLSVSFGTSYEETRKKTIDVVDDLLARAFPDCAFYSAWTSGRIVARIRSERGEHHDTLEEAFDRLDADGIDDLVVATMCLMQGHEMAKVTRFVREWEQASEGRRAHIANPLLTDEVDRQMLAEAIVDEFAGLASEEALLLMGHGCHVPVVGSDGRSYDANAVYGQMQDALHALGRPKFFVATVEGTPTFDDALALIRKSGVMRVHLAPFMIVAGDHAQNDLVSDDEDSWKSMLEAQGFQVSVTLRGLGEYAAVQQLVVDHAKKA